MPKTNHHRQIVSGNVRLPVAPTARLMVVMVMLVFVVSCLEGFARMAVHTGGSVLVVDAWMVNNLTRRRSGTTTIHNMGKGFNKARNKQAELAKKIVIAKSQNQAVPSTSDEIKTSSNNDRDIKAQQKSKDTDDNQQERMKEFETLLRTTKGAIPWGDDSGSDSGSANMNPAGSKTKKKKIVPQVNHNRSTKSKRKKDEKNNNNVGNNRNTQGVVIEARRQHFESLIDATTSAPLGPIGAAKLVPWVGPLLKKGLIVFVDPRSNSKDLRRTMLYHATSSLLDGNIDVDIAFVTADSVGESQAWLKRNEITPNPTSNKIHILCDAQWSFMKKYEIVGDTIDHPWSMAMMAFDTKGDIVRMERDVEPSHCNQLVSDTRDKDLNIE